MPSLFEYQCRIARGLLAQPEQLRSGSKVDTRPGSDALDVHRATVARTLLEVLRTTFRTVQLLIGATPFERVAMRYLSESPPRTALLHEYGGTFPHALALALPDSSHLESVARFDFLVEQVSRDVVGGLGVRIALASGATVRLEKSLRCGEFDYPVDSIRESVHNDRPDVKALLTTGSPRRLAIWRTSAGISVLSLSAPAYRFVAALSVGHRASEALQRASERCAPEEALAAIRKEVLGSPLVSIPPVNPFAMDNSHASSGTL